MPVNNNTAPPVALESNDITHWYREKPGQPIQYGTPVSRHSGPVQIGASVSVQRPDHTLPLRGTIVAVGKDGVVVEDPIGQEWRVRHEHILEHTPPRDADKGPLLAPHATGADKDAASLPLPLSGNVGDIHLDDGRVQAFLTYRIALAEHKRKLVLAAATEETSYEKLSQAIIAALQYGDSNTDVQSQDVDACIRRLQKSDVIHQSKKSEVSATLLQFMQDDDLLRLPHRRIQDLLIEPCSIYIKAWKKLVDVKISICIDILGFWPVAGDVLWIQDHVMAKNTPILARVTESDRYRYGGDIRAQVYRDDKNTELNTVAIANIILPAKTKDIRDAGWLGDVLPADAALLETRYHSLEKSLKSSGIYDCKIEPRPNEFIHQDDHTRWLCGQYGMFLDYINAIRIVLPLQNIGQDVLRLRIYSMSAENTAHAVYQAGYMLMDINNKHKNTFFYEYGRFFDHAASGILPSDIYPSPFASSNPHPYNVKTGDRVQFIENMAPDNAEYATVIRPPQSKDDFKTITVKDSNGKEYTTTPTFLYSDTRDNPNIYSITAVMEKEESIQKDINLASKYLENEELDRYTQPNRIFARLFACWCVYKLHSSNIQDPRFTEKDNSCFIEYDDDTVKKFGNLLHSCWKNIHLKKSRDKTIISVRSKPLTLPVGSVLKKSGSVIHPGARGATHWYYNQFGKLVYGLPPLPDYERQAIHRRDQQDDNSWVNTIPIVPTDHASAETLRHQIYQEFHNLGYAHAGVDIPESISGNVDHVFYQTEQMSRLIGNVRLLHHFFPYGGQDVLRFMVKDSLLPNRDVQALYNGAKIRMYIGPGYQESFYHEYGHFIDHAASNFLREHKKHHSKLHNIDQEQHSDDKKDDAPDDIILPVYATMQAFASPNRPGDEVEYAVDAEGTTWKRGTLLTPPSKGNRYRTMSVRAADGHTLEVDTGRVHHVPKPNDLTMHDFAQQLASMPTVQGFLRQVQLYAPEDYPQTSLPCETFARWFDRWINWQAHRGGVVDNRMMTHTPYEQWSDNDMLALDTAFRRVLLTIPALKSMVNNVLLQKGNDKDNINKENDMVKASTLNRTYNEYSDITYTQDISIQPYAEIINKSTANENIYQDGCMIALFVPQDVAQRIALPDGELPENMHITVVYLGKVHDIQKEEEIIKHVISDVASTTPIMHGNIIDIGTFPSSNSSNGTEVRYATVDIAGLLDLRRKLVDILDDYGIEDESSFPNYIPHITLKYVPEGTPKENESFPPISVVFDKLVFSIGERRIVFQLKGST